MGYGFAVVHRYAWLRRLKELSDSIGIPVPELLTWDRDAVLDLLDCDAAYWAWKGED